MQKRIIFALGICCINGIVAQEQAPEAAPLISEQNVLATAAQATTPEVAASQNASEPSDSHAAPSAQTVEQAPAPTAVTENQPAAESASAPATQEAPPVSETVSPSVQEQHVAPQEVAAQPAQTPAAPVATQPVAAEVPEEHAEELEIKGIDTVNVAEPKGNWLYKRIWWEKAERTYEKIKQLAEKIQEARILFFAKRTDLDRNTLDPFYLGQGFTQGELTEIINFLTAQIEQDRKEGTLDEKEQALLNALSEEKKNLENLQKGAKAVESIDHALDDALLKLSEQLQQARSYEQQAWENFKAINRELSDKRARELYYGMDTYWRNLNNINSYISDSFSNYFDQLSDRLKQEVDKIRGTMDTLKEKGIDIQLQAQRLKAVKPAEHEEEEVAEVAESRGIVDTLWHWIKAPFAAVANMFGDLFGWVSGSTQTEELSLARPERSKEQ